MEVNPARLINIPTITDVRGNLSVIDGLDCIPFTIKRVYFIHNVPGGEERGGHAHKTMDQFLVATSGSFDVRINQPNGLSYFTLNRADQGLLIPSGCWRDLYNFSSGAVCTSLVSTHYDPGDYIRSVDELNAFWIGGNN